LRSGGLAIGLFVFLLLSLSSFSASYAAYIKITQITPSYHGSKMNLGITVFYSKNYYTQPIIALDVITRDNSCIHYKEFCADPSADRDFYIGDCKRGSYKRTYPGSYGGMVTFYVNDIPADRRYDLVVAMWKDNSFNERLARNKSSFSPTQRDYCKDSHVLCSPSWTTSCYGYVYNYNCKTCSYGCTTATYTPSCASGNIQSSSPYDPPSSDDAGGSSGTSSGSGYSPSTGSSSSSSGGSSAGGAYIKLYSVDIKCTNKNITVTLFYEAGPYSYDCTYMAYTKIDDNFAVGPCLPGERSSIFTYSASDKYTHPLGYGGHAVTIFLYSTGNIVKTIRGYVTCSRPVDPCDGSELVAGSLGSPVPYNATHVKINVNTNRRGYFKASTPSKLVWKFTTPSGRTIYVSKDYTSTNTRINYDGYIIVPAERYTNVKLELHSSNGRVCKTHSYGGVDYSSHKYNFEFQPFTYYYSEGTTYYVWLHVKYKSDHDANLVAKIDHSSWDCYLPKSSNGYRICYLGSFYPDIDGDNTYKINYTVYAENSDFVLSKKSSLLMLGHQLTVYNASYTTKQLPNGSYAITVSLKYAANFRPLLALDIVSTNDKNMVLRTNNLPYRANYYTFKSGHFYKEYCANPARDRELIGGCKRGGFSALPTSHYYGEIQNMTYSKTVSVPPGYYRVIISLWDIFTTLKSHSYYEIQKYYHDFLKWETLIPESVCLDSYRMLAMSFDYNASQVGYNLHPHEQYQLNDSVYKSFIYYPSGYPYNGFNYHYLVECAYGCYDSSCTDCNDQNPCTRDYFDTYLESCVHENLTGPQPGCSGDYSCVNGQCTLVPLRIESYGVCNLVNGDLYCDKILSSKYDIFLHVDFNKNTLAKLCVNNGTTTCVTQGGSGLMYPLSNSLGNHWIKFNVTVGNTTLLSNNLKYTVVNNDSFIIQYFEGRSKSLIEQLIQGNVMFTLLLSVVNVMFNFADPDTLLIPSLASILMFVALFFSNAIRSLFADVILKAAKNVYKKIHGSLTGFYSAFKERWKRFASNFSLGRILTRIFTDKHILWTFVKSAAVGFLIGFGINLVTSVMTGFASLLITLALVIAFIVQLAPAITGILSLLGTSIAMGDDPEEDIAVYLAELLGSGAGGFAGASKAMSKVINKYHAKFKGSKVESKLSGLLDSISGFMDNITSKVKEKIRSLFDNFGKGLKNILAPIKNKLDSWKKGSGILGGIFSKITKLIDGAKSIWNKIKSGLKNIWNDIRLIGRSKAFKKGYVAIQKVLGYAPESLNKHMERFSNMQDDAIFTIKAIKEGLTAQLIAHKKYNEGIAERMVNDAVEDLMVSVARNYDDVNKFFSSKRSKDVIDAYMQLYLAKQDGTLSKMSADVDLENLVINRGKSKEFRLYKRLAHIYELSREARRRLNDLIQLSSNYKKLADKIEAAMKDDVFMSMVTLPEVYSKEGASREVVAGRLGRISYLDEDNLLIKTETKPLSYVDKDYANIVLSYVAKIYDNYKSSPQEFSMISNPYFVKNQGGLLRFDIRLDVDVKLEVDGEERNKVMEFIESKIGELKGDYYVIRVGEGYKLVKKEEFKSKKFKPKDIVASVNGLGISPDNDDIFAYTVLGEPWVVVNPYINPSNPSFTGFLLLHEGTHRVLQCTFHVDVGKALFEGDIGNGLFNGIRDLAGLGEINADISGIVNGHFSFGDVLKNRIGWLDFIYKNKAVLDGTSRFSNYVSFWLLSYREAAIAKINPSNGKTAFYRALHRWISHNIWKREFDQFVDRVVLRDKTMRAEFKDYLKRRDGYLMRCLKKCEDKSKFEKYLKKLRDNERVLRIISDWEGEDLVALRRAAEGMVEVSQSVKPLKVYDLRYLKAAINNPTYDRGPMKVYDTVSPYTLKQIASLDAHVYGSQASDSLFTNQTTK